MFANPTILNLHYYYGISIYAVYVRPQANSLWAEEDRLHRCDNPPSLARCQNTGNGISDFFTKERLSARAVLFFHLIITSIFNFI